jgi:hypothetical protein
VGRSLNATVPGTGVGQHGQEEAIVSLVGWLRISIGRLRQGWLVVVESTAAATVAWLVGTRFIGHP